MSARRQHIRQILLLVLAASSCVALRESGLRGVVFKSDADYNAALQPNNNQGEPAFMRFSEYTGETPSQVLQRSNAKESEALEGGQVLRRSDAQPSEALAGGATASEWKSSSFCTQVDFLFPPKLAPGPGVPNFMPVQVVVSVAMAGTSQFDKNSDGVGDTEVVKASFMVGLAGSIQVNTLDLEEADGSSKIAMAASMFIQGDMEIVSRVPAEFLVVAGGIRSPVLGTLWALKKFVAHKIEVSPWYKWFKNKEKKKENLNAAMKTLLQEIHQDLQGVNDASNKAECERFCHDKTMDAPNAHVHGFSVPPVCEPPTPDAAKKQLSLVSATCDAGAKYVKAFVDFCGEYDMESKQCTPYKDNKMDSDAIADSATIKFIEFVNELRSRGPKLMAAKAEAYDARKYTGTLGRSLSNAYRDEIEEAWRLVYLGDSEARAKLGYSYELACRKIPGVYSTSTDKIIAPEKVIMPLFCAWMRAGASLENAHTSYLGSHLGSRSNQNLKESLPVIYPELFPAPGRTAAMPDPVFDKWLAKMTAAQGSQDRLDKSSYLGGWVDNKDHGLDINSMNVHAVHMILAMPPDAMGESLTKAMDDIAITAGSVVKEQNAARGCTATATGCCGVQEVSLRGTMGVTMGTSIVGFCTPDTNPFQKLQSTAFTYSVSESLTTPNNGICVLGDKSWEPRVTTLTGVIPLDADGNHFMYINYAEEVDWGASFHGLTVGGMLSGYTSGKSSLSFSYLTKALNQRIGTTLVLTPICTALNWIWAKIKLGVEAIKAVFYQKKMTPAIAATVVTNTKNLLTNSISDYCNQAEKPCGGDTRAEGAIGWLHAISATAGQADPSTMLTAAGTWAAGLLETIGGIKLGRDTYTKVDLRLVWDATGKPVMGTDGTGMSFGVESISEFALETAATGSGALLGADVKAAFYMGSGSSVDCGEA